MNRRYGLIAVGVVGALAVAAPIAAAPPGTDYNTPHSQTTTCTNGLSVTYKGPSSMWPPNHKYQPFSVTGADSLETPMLSLTTTGTHDQYDGDTEDTEANGSGHTADDITVTDSDAEVTTANNDAQPAATESGDGSVTTDWAARSERSGRLKDGRSYTVTGTVKDATGARTCMGTWTIAVPHDQRKASDS